MSALAKQMYGRSRVVDLRPRRPEPDVRQKVGNAFLVESETDTEAFLHWILTTAGINAVSFATGRDLLAALEDDDRGCVLLNLQSSGVDFVAILEALARRRVPLPAVLYSGPGNPLGIVQPLATGTANSNGDSFGFVVVEHVKRAMEHAERSRSARRNAERACACLADLTKREMEVAKSVVGGKANKLIAFDLGISDRTVEIHRARIMRKTKCDSLAELVWMFAAAGLPNSVSAWPTEDLIGHLNRSASTTG